MDTTEKKFFRKSLIGGFSKTDVSNYILESTQKYTQQIKEAEEKLSAVTAEKDALAARLSEAEAKLSELGGVSEKLSALESAHADVLARLSETEEKLSAKTQENAELSEKVNSLASVEGEYTTRKAELAEIELAARARAAEICSAADREADEKRLALEEELALRRRDFNDKQNEAYREAGDTISIVARLVDSLKNEIDGIDARINRITDSVHNNVGSIADAVSDAQNKIANIRSRIMSNEEN